MLTKLITYARALLAVLVVALFAISVAQLSTIASQNQNIADRVAKIADTASKQANSQLASQIDASAFQAVFLDTGQVYFGKLQELNTRYFSLTDVYYLQGDGATASGGLPSGNVSLVKLGEELHGPKDDMYIPQSEVTFIENLKSSGQVAKEIKAYEAKHKP